MGEYGEYGEHGAHGKDGKHQTDDLKQSINDLKHYISDTKHLFGNQMTQTLYFTAFMPTIQKHTRSKDILSRLKIGEHEEKRGALDGLSSVSFCRRLGFAECLRK